MQPPPQEALSPRAKVTMYLEELALLFEGSRDWPYDAEKTPRLETALGVLVQGMPPAPAGADELAVDTDDLIKKLETSNKALRAYDEILKLAVKKLEVASGWARQGPSWVTWRACRSGRART